MIQVTDLVGLDAMREQMNAVNLRSARPCPFSTSHYLRNALVNDELSEPGRGPDVRVLVAMEGERLVGFLPLGRFRERPLGIPRNRLGWIVLHDGDRPHVIAAPEDEARCAAAFVAYIRGRRRREWTALEFANQDSASVLRSAVELLPRAGYYVRLLPANPHSVLTIEWATLDEYFKACPKAFRQSVARRGRHLVAAGRVEWICSTDAASGVALFDAYLALEQNSWKRGTAAAVARHPARVAQYRGLFDDSAPMKAAVNLLTIDGEPVGGQVSASFASGVFGLETAFDEQRQNLSPGNVTHLLMVNDCLRRGMEFYSLRSLFAYHKESWLARTIPTDSIQVFRRGSVYHLKARLGEWRRRLRRTEEQPVDHNPAKREATGAGHGDTPRADSRAVLERALASGIRVERLSPDEVRAALPWNS